MDEDDNLWRRPVVRAATDRTLPSTCGSKPNETSPQKPSATIRRLISELGLRYRPLGGVQADLAAHAAQLGLLARDLADLPPDRLEAAIAAWVRTERWMPKASELVAIAQRQQQEEIDGRPGAAEAKRANAFSHASLRNADLMREGGRSDIEWTVDEAGSMRLRYRRPPVGPIAPIDPRDVSARNEALANFGATFRYDDGGYRRDLTFDEEERRLAAGGKRWD